MSTRERRHDFCLMRGATLALIARVAQDRKSHANMMDLRSEMLFSREEWPRLTGAHQQELLGMLRGAVDAWHACGAIVWTHVLDGVRMPAAAVGDRISEIDLASSQHAWAADLTRLF